MSRRSRGASVAHPLDIFYQVQLGFAPAASVTRTFLTQHFRTELEQRHYTDVKLAALDHRSITQLLRQLLFNRYLAVPCRAMTFDLEFTSLPRFTSEGPMAEIVEWGLYCPTRDAQLSLLIKPNTHEISPEVEELTGIRNEDAKRGMSFAEAWKHAEEFIFASDPLLDDASKDAVLLLSHGGKAADLSMLDWAFRGIQQKMPSSIRFGDTYHMIVDLHRRRPVTIDKHPPSWKLADLHEWMKLPPPTVSKNISLPKRSGRKSSSTERAHRAGHDATLTWKVLEGTLSRYGDDCLTATQQLVQRFFGDKTTEALQKSGTLTSAPLPADPIELDLDD